MTANEYVPSDDHMRSLFCQGYAQGDFDKHDRAWVTWERWLTAHDARVRRDAAREALDGLADQFNNWAEADAEESVRVYRDTHYPEKEGHHA